MDKKTIRQEVEELNHIYQYIKLQLLKGLERRPTPKQAREMINHGSPWRSIGALFLWRYYHHHISVNK